MSWVPAREYPHLTIIVEWGFDEPMAWFPDGAAITIARIRRGKYVMIPPEWRGKVPHPPTIRKRLSKRPHKQRRGHIGDEPVKGDEQLTVQERRAPSVDDELTSS